MTSDSIIPCVTQRPEQVIVELRRALSSGEFDEAVRIVTAAIPQHPNDPAPLFLLCTALLERQDQRAVGFLSRIEQFPAYSPGWLAIGRTLLQLKRAEGALVAFGHVATHGAPSEKRYAALGRAAALEALNQPGRAAEALADIPSHERDGPTEFHRALLDSVPGSGVGGGHRAVSLV